MTRPDELFLMCCDRGGWQKTADVHPLETENYARHGWWVEKEPAPKAKAKAKAKPKPKAKAKTAATVTSDGNAG